jgi:hypothetical protein
VAGFEAAGLDNALKEEFDGFFAIGIQGGFPGMALERHLLGGRGP